MPARVSEKTRPIVTPGSANDVEDREQFPVPIARLAAVCRSS
jgi:hypothetical protein